MSINMVEASLSGASPRSLRSDSAPTSWAGEAPSVGLRTTARGKTAMGAQPEKFRLLIPDADIADLRERLLRTRFPDQGPGEPWAYGADLAYLRSLTEYWQFQFDWRAQEARLNAFPQYKVPLHGIDLHFLHVPGNGPEPLPLLLSHGWPGSAAATVSSGRKAELRRSASRSEAAIFARSDRSLGRDLAGSGMAAFEAETAGSCRSLRQPNLAGRSWPTCARSETWRTTRKWFP